MGLPADLEAFYLEHRRCGEMDGGAHQLTPGCYAVWMSCSCGARLERREPTPS